MTAELGLDQPILTQFGRYLLGAVSGNFGTSYSLKRPVSELMGAALGNTLKLALFASLFAWITGILCGVLAAVRKDSIPDRLFMGFSLLGISLPVFMAAMFLQYVFAFRLHWLPIAGTDSWTGFILPAAALGWNSAGQVAQITRTTLLETLQEDYIETARAKGRGTSGVLMFHALRNAMLPVLTMMTIQFSGLLSGAVITESVFSIPGLGKLALTAVQTRDMPLLQGPVLFTALLIAVGNILADVINTLLNPRLRTK
jgi:peptide/nickel transport system permease protein